MDIGRTIGLIAIASASIMMEDPKADPINKQQAALFLESLQEMASRPIEMSSDDIKNRFASAAIKKYGDTLGVQGVIAQTHHMYDLGEYTMQEMESAIQFLESA